MKHTRRRPTTTDPERRTQATGRFRRDRGPSPAQPRASGTRAGATHGCTHPVRAPRQMLILRGSQPLGASGRGRPRGPAERSAEAAEAATAAPATQGVAPTPLASSATRTEVPESTEEHTVSIAAGGMGRMGHWFEPWRPPRTVSSPPKSCPKSPPGGLATRGSAPCAKTALSRSHSVGAVESGERRARHTTVTRTGRRHGGRSRRAPSRRQRGG